MKTLNLYFKFHFTSLSLDAQPISLGIVSDEKKSDKNTDPKKLAKLLTGQKVSEFFPSKSFYAEFTDFDINRCDDWVKDNVISKLRNRPVYLPSNDLEDNTIKGIKIPNCCWEKEDLSRRDCDGNIGFVKKQLLKWLEQFKDYEIQFVMDCSQLGWLWMVELLDARGLSNQALYMVPDSAIPNNMTGKEFLDELKKSAKEGGGIIVMDGCEKITEVRINKPGLPILPENTSPIPQDLNDLISIKKSITPKEAFELDREEFAYGPVQVFVNDNVKFDSEPSQKYNALWDAKVIKEVYQKLNS